MLQESVSNVISLLALFSEKDRNTSAFLLMMVSSKFYTFLLDSQLVSILLFPELRRKWKASKEESLCSESCNVSSYSTENVFHEMPHDLWQ